MARFKDLTNTTLGETIHAAKGIVTLEGYVYLLKETLLVSVIWFLAAALIWSIYVWPRKNKLMETTKNEEQIDSSP